MLRFWGAFLPKTGGSGERSHKVFEMAHKCTKMEGYAVPFLERGCAEKRFVL